MSVYCKKHFKNLRTWASILERLHGVRKQRDFVKLSVRFRKSLALGRAPSKRNDPNYFKKSYPTQEDQKWAEPIYESYNAALVSLVAAFQEELLQQQNKVSDDNAEGQLVWNEHAHHETCMKYIRTTNDKLQKERLLRLEKLKKEQDAVNEEISKKLSERLMAEQACFEEEVKLTENQSEDWVTLENCEERVVKAINFPINVNFAVKIDGTVCKRTAQVLK